MVGYQEYFGETHRMVRETVRKFVDREIRPFVDDWEEQGGFPRELYTRAGDAGILGIGYPERYGGSGGDIFVKIVAVEELMRCGSAGVAAGLGSLDIGLPPVLALGTEEQKQRFIPPVLRGERIAALGITEPDAGSDVANIRTRAVRELDHYVVNGSKMFITSGARADQLTCAVRTGGEGAGGISLLIVEADTHGYSVSERLKKMGWWASDTAQIFFDDCRVPAGNLLGEEGQGFYGIMENFQNERLHLSVMANMTAQLAMEEALRYAREREAFNRPLSAFQVTRHKLADMATLVEASREFTYRVAAKIDAGQDQVRQISMAKNFACTVSDKVTYDAVQIHGGFGYMREYLVERLYRDNRILSIGGGTQEIMKEIISRAILG
ncbi:MAG: acyl-CoA dehydrogenase family protein [Deltaproteobacteria bacterium]|nr:acyl-CoA dehydrogenase family protein [Deltaproteobacteria bacterium]MBW2110179.1 acyl-CoA dehydrogenase family protein [Deltaproteobacteria bacterium]MBW2352681.1 acyl-CoA dehydrogenase family protein [Deltaproteobacteria bacterium]HDZ91362.1 acyl-CoA dehydrogenase [Deltaproteobacteria bacterium]